MGLVTAGIAYTTGEITAFMPDTGGFIRHATKFVEPALGAATGWNFCKLTINILERMLGTTDNCL
jgi:amino acid transporter